jgi:hypothetical protein
MQLLPLLSLALSFFQETQRHRRKTPAYVVAHEKGISNIPGRKGDIVPSHSAPTHSRGGSPTIPHPLPITTSGQYNISTEHSPQTITKGQGNGTFPQNTTMEHHSRIFSWTIATEPSNGTFPQNIPIETVTRVLTRHYGCTRSTPFFIGQHRSSRPDTSDETLTRYPEQD